MDYSCSTLLPSDLGPDSELNSYKDKWQIRIRLRFNLLSSLAREYHSCSYLLQSCSQRTPNLYNLVKISN